MPAAASYETNLMSDDSFFNPNCHVAGTICTNLNKSRGRKS